LEEYNLLFSPTLTICGYILNLSSLMHSVVVLVLGSPNLK